MQFKRNWFRKRKSIEVEGNPFKNRTSLGKFLGQTAAAIFAGEISEKEGHEIERLCVDFLKVLNVHDFNFELSEALSPSDDREKLRYST